MKNKNNKKKSQNLLEYILIFAMVAVAGYAFVAKFDLSRLKNYVFSRSADTADTSKIKIEAMTE